MTVDGGKNDIITSKQIKTEPYVHQHARTARIMVLYVSRWEAAEVWRIAAVGYFSIDFVFVCRLLPSSCFFMPVFLHAASPLFPPFSLSQLLHQVYSKRHLSGQLIDRTQHGYSSKKSKLALQPAREPLFDACKIKEMLHCHGIGFHPHGWYGTVLKMSHGKEVFYFLFVEHL